MRLLFAMCAAILFFPTCSGRSASPDEVVMNIAKSVDAGHPEAIWDALPPSYQADIDSVRILIATHMDRELYDKSFQVFRKLVTLLKTKGEFILGNPQLSSFDQGQPSKEAWDAMVASLEALATSDLATLDGLRELDIRRFLSTSGSTMAKQALSLSRIGPTDKPKLERLSDIKVSVVKREKDRATLSITAGDETEEQEWVLVEGKWVPEEIAREWNLTELKNQLRSFSITTEQRTQALMVIGLVENAIDQLLATTSQEQFNQVVQGLLGVLKGGMVGGTLGTVPGMPGAAE